MSKAFDLVWTPPAFLFQTEDGSISAPDGYEFGLPLAQTGSLLDLHDCISDLESVIAVGKVLEAEAAGGSFNFELFHALIITYGRGFQSGKSRGQNKSRANLRQFVDRLTSDQIELHDEVMNVRNRRVAHAVDTGRAIVTVTFARDGSFVDVGAVHMGLPVGLTDVRNAVALATEFRALASAESDRLTDELRHQWRGKSLSPEQLTAVERELTEFLAAAS